MKCWAVTVLICGIVQVMSYSHRLVIPRQLDQILKWKESTLVQLDPEKNWCCIPLSTSYLGTNQRINICILLSLPNDVWRLIVFIIIIIILVILLSFRAPWTCPRQISGTTGQNFMICGKGGQSHIFGGSKGVGVTI